MTLNKKYCTIRVDNHKEIEGSLMYDSEQDCWRIIEYLFDIESPKLDNQFGICAHEVVESSIKVA